MIIMICTGDLIAAVTLGAAVLFYKGTTEKLEIACRIQAYFE